MQKYLAGLIRHGLAGLRRSALLTVLGVLVALPFATTPSFAGPGGIGCAYSGSPGGPVMGCGNLLSTFLGNLIAEITGNAVSTAVDGAVATGLGNQSGPALGFAGEPDRSARYADALNALAYQGTGKPGLAAPAPISMWSIWGDLRGTHWTGSSTNNFSGSQTNGTAGIGYRASNDLVVGVLGGFESFDYSLQAIPGTLKGSGGTIGAYTGWRFHPNWRFDGALAFSALGYEAAVVGTGSFNARRLLASAGATGTYAYGSLVVEPSARIFALFEDRDAWTDTNNVVNTAQSLSVGRGSIGARLIMPAMTSLGTLTPFVGLYGDYRFASNNGQLVTGVQAIAGFSGRVTAGVGLTTPAGAKFTLDGEVGGIGADFTEWAAHGRAAIPF